MEYLNICHENDFTQQVQPDTIAEFLYRYLDDFRDDLCSIRLAIDHALGFTGVEGGFILAAMDEARIIGVLVMNRTGMTGFIPENVLVYVAIHTDYRGKGIGRQLVERAINQADGDVKLHVEYDNPAKRLYERIGFTSKYAEMRFKKGN